MKVKWQHLKGAALKAADAEARRTGGGPPAEFTPIQTKILEEHNKRKSNKVQGIPGGIDTMVSVIWCVFMWCIFFENDSRAV